jgi:hypothetical protein
MEFDVESNGKELNFTLFSVPYLKFSTTALVKVPVSPVLF